jgi:hypothetical protein
MPPVSPDVVSIVEATWRSDRDRAFVAGHLSVYASAGNLSPGEEARLAMIRREDREQ